MVDRDKILLIVEDEVVIALAKQKELEEYGYNVITVYTGEKAVEVVKEHCDIDMILMDIELGEGINGTQAAEIILKEREIPIVFMSSHTEPKIVEKAEKIRSYGYVAKSSCPAVLDASVKIAFKLFDKEIIERIEGEEKLKKINVAVEQSPESIVITNLKGDIEYVNPKFCDLTGYSLEEAKGKNSRILQSGETPMETFKELWETVLAGKVWHGEFLNKKKNGELYWENAIISPILNDNGNITSYVGIKADITKRKQIEKELKQQLLEKEIILKESHHRIKNNFASIVSLLSLQEQSITNPEGQSALQDAIGRIMSMQVLYEKLLLTKDYCTASVKEYLGTLICDIINLFPENTNISVKKQIDDFELDPKKLSPLGIIINELLTNIMKYAFSGRNTGLIEVTVKENKGDVTLTVEDNGNGLPEDFDIDAQTGFGLMLIKMLTEQLCGTFTIENKNGVKSTLKFII